MKHGTTKLTVILVVVGLGLAILGNEMGSMSMGALGGFFICVGLLFLFMFSH